MHCVAETWLSTAAKRSSSRDQSVSDAHLSKLEVADMDVHPVFCPERPSHLKYAGSRRSCLFDGAD